MIEWHQLLCRNPRQRLLEGEHVRPLQLAYQIVNEIVTIIEKSEMQLRADRKEIEEALANQINGFDKELAEVQAQVHALAVPPDETIPGKAQQTRDHIMEIIDHLKQLTEQMHHINEQQTHLEMMVTEYPQIDTLKAEVDPHKKLWVLYVEYDMKTKAWKNSEFKNLVPDDVEADYKKFKQQANNLGSIFDSKKPAMPVPAKVAKKMATDLAKMKDTIPLIRALCNPGLMERHVQNIYKEIGLVAQIDLPDLSLKMIDQNIGQGKLTGHKTIIEDISDRASKEYSNSSTMAKMKDDWGGLEFSTTPVEGKDSAILQGEAVEVLSQTLDDHIIKTQGMKGSPFAKFMLPEIEEWEKMLMTTQDNLEIWLTVQAVWMSLEPVFSSEDIINQMPLEGRLFKEVNAMWHKLMCRVTENPAALTVVAIDDLQQTLKACNTKLERVQKGLSDYLESKRGLFPRFYFLSDDELLEILSETKEPLRVQPHLKKCFEGIHKLKFDEERKIHGMYSIEGEFVPYTRVIDPNASKGMVENWLLQVEEVMLKSVKAVVEQSFQDYQRTARDKWIVSWQGQAVLCISCLYWT